MTKFVWLRARTYNYLIDDSFHAKRAQKVYYKKKS